MFKHAQLIVKWEYGTNGANVTKHVDLELNPELELLLFNLHSEDNHVLLPMR